MLKLVMDVDPGSSHLLAIIYSGDRISPQAGDHYAETSLIGRGLGSLVLE